MKLNKCKGWGTATPESPYHNYEWDIHSNHYEHHGDKLNTIRIMAIQRIEEIDAEGTEHTYYSYPTIEWLQLDDNFTQLASWLIHSQMMNHLVYCMKCNDIRLCDKFYQDFPYPKYEQEMDDPDDWPDIF